MLRKRSQPPAALQEEALELGWTEEDLLEAIAYASVEIFSALVNIAGDVPVEGVELGVAGRIPRAARRQHAEQDGVVLRQVAASAFVNSSDRTHSNRGRYEPA